MKRSANILLSICKEVAKVCADQNIHAAEDFIQYFVKLTLLDPVWNVSLYSDEIIRVNVQNLIKHIVSKLGHPSCPCMISMRMQLFMEQNKNQLTSYAEKTMAYLLAQLIPLQTDIVETLTPSTKAETALVYKKVVYFITLLQGLGNPSTVDVFREAKQALLSIMREPDLLAFLQQPTSNKIDDLDEISHIVCGIRLFNRDCKKGGYGIEDLPTILSQSLIVMNREAESMLSFTLENVNLITTAIEECFKAEWKESFNNYVIYYELPEGVEYEDMEYSKDVLLAYRQFEVYLRYIITEIHVIEKVVEDLTEQLTAALTNIHNTVDCMYAVLTDVVFPKFIACAKVWREILNQTLIVSRLKEVQTHLSDDIRQIILNEEILMLMLGNKESMTDEDRLNETMGQKIDTENNLSTVIYPSSKENLSKFPIEYLGFCAWKLVETQGGLVPGNPNIGISTYKDRYYTFSSLEAAEAFGREPEKFTKQLIDICRKKPELINFLDIEDQLDAVQHKKTLYEQPKPTILTNVQEVQTVLHPDESHIDPSYKWNIWDYKREALTLANISRMKTHSTQTEQSNNINAIGVQTYVNKEQPSQTNCDNYTNVPTLSNFIYGLRGRKDDKQCVIQLTRPPEE